MASPPADMPSRVGPYELLEELGRGGMGAVYRARDPALGREVAIKLLLAGRGGGETQRARFAREGKALARLQHPHVVSVHDAGEHQGTPYLVMDLVAGESLQARLDRDGPLPLPDALHIARCLCAATAHAHTRGVLHRDIKPLNVLLDRQGRPRLTDFGLTRALDLQATQRLSKSGHLLGTPGYCPPEQVRGDAGEIGPASDVYGLGATLYAMLTGRPPLVATTLLEFMDQTTRQRPDPPSRWRPELPPGLDALCLRCLEKDPARRPADPRELDAGLERIEQGRDAAPPDRLPRAVAAALVLAGALLALGILRNAAHTPAAAPQVAAPPTAPHEPAPAPTAAARAVALCDRGGEALEAGQAQRARELFDQALEADPRYGRAWNNRGLARQQLGDAAGALVDFDHALQAELPAPAAHLTRALARLDQGDPAGARADAQALLDADPEDPEAYALLARVAVAAEDRQAALSALQRSLELRPTPEAYTQRCALKVQGGDLAGAVEDVQLALLVTPLDDPRRAQLESQLKQLEPLLNLGQQTPPTSTAAERAARERLLAQARQREASGAWTEALKLYQRYREALPPLGEQARALRVVLGRVYARRAGERLQAGARAAAVRDLEQALSELPARDPDVPRLTRLLQANRQD